MKFPIEMEPKPLPNPTPEDIEAGATEICKAVSGYTPFFIGRNGTIELETFYYWFTFRKSGKPYSPRLLHTMAANAGVWPATEASLDAWATEYAGALGLADGLAAGWYAPYRSTESILLQYFAPNAFLTPLRSLEPYYMVPEKRWTRHLIGKRVAVVTSFASSVAYQAQRPALEIWSNVAEPSTILPPADWVPIRTYYSPSLSPEGDPTGWPEPIKTWQDAVAWTVERVLATQATVAIIGCGGLGMLVGARLRAAGVSAFVLGGATQVLFGIKGQRWATHPTISGFWTDAWVWPSAAETPAGARAVEGGCYWGPPRT